MGTYLLTHFLDIKRRTVMGKNLEKATALRNDPDVHYNCAQSVVCAFAEDCGLTDDDGPTVAGYQRAIRDNHSGCLNCADLLRMNKEKGGLKKPHCDGMVYESTALLEKIIKERKSE